MSGTLPSPAVRNAMLLWTMVAFLGGWVLFGSLRRATEDSSTAVSVLVQVGALAVVIGVVVLVVRYRKPPGPR
jgi:membrane protein DedA with SNARE-associated domain